MTFNAFFSEILQRKGPAYGIGLERMQALLKRWENPEKNIKTIHVAGTNGKGSLCYLCSSVLQAAGYKTGLFISPHLSSVCERISINGQHISRAMLLRLCQEVLSYEEQNGPKMNFFEILTLAAFLYFSRKKVDFLVLETGLGGRKDPTNVCAACMVLVGGIGLDHCQVLGNTLSAIAQEKAGIIKDQTPVFATNLPPEALAVLQTRANKCHAPFFYEKDARPFSLEKIDWKKGFLLLRKNKALWRLGLLGENQAENASVVYRAMRFLAVPDSLIKKGFAQAKAPARFEMFYRQGKLFIIDGAHNPQAAQGLVDFLKKSPFCQKANLVCGFMQDKDFGQMLRIWAPHFKEIFVAQLGTERSAETELVRKVMPASAKAFYFSSPVRALDEAQKTAEVVVVSGSFYLAGALRTRIGARKD